MNHWTGTFLAPILACFAISLPYPSMAQVPTGKANAPKSPSAVESRQQAKIQAREQQRNVIIRIGATTVTELDLQATLQQYPPQMRRTILDDRNKLSKLADDILARRIIAKQAERRGMARDLVVESLLRVTRERILSEARLYEIGEEAWPNEALALELARKQYAESPDKYTTPMRQRAAHILYAAAPGDPDRPKAKLKAEAALVKLSEGKDFAALAKEESADKATSGFGGDLGFFVSGSLVPEFESAVNALQKPGDMTGIVETQFGFHIIKLIDRREAVAKSFEEMKESLLQTVTDRAHRTAQQAAAAEAVRKATRSDKAIDAIVAKHAQKP